MISSVVILHDQPPPLNTASREVKEAAVRRILAGEKVLLARREVADRGRREP